MATSFEDGSLLWEPSEQVKQLSTLTRYMQWLEHTRGLSLQSQADLWQGSVDHLEDFWASMWDVFQIQAPKPYSNVLVERKMSRHRRVAGDGMNYHHQVVRNACTNSPSLI